MKTKRRIEITRYSRRVTVIHGTGAARSAEAGEWAADLVIEQSEFPLAGLVSNEGPPSETTEDQTVAAATAFPIGQTHAANKANLNEAYLHFQKRRIN